MPIYKGKAHPFADEDRPDIDVGLEDVGKLIGPGVAGLVTKGALASLGGPVAWTAAIVVGLATLILNEGGPDAEEYTRKFLLETNNESIAEGMGLLAADKRIDEYYSKMGDLGPAAQQLQMEMGAVNAGVFDAEIQEAQDGARQAPLGQPSLHDQVAEKIGMSPNYLRSKLEPSAMDQAIIRKQTNG